MGQQIGRNNEGNRHFKGIIMAKTQATSDLLGTPTVAPLTPEQAHNLVGSNVLLSDLLKKIRALFGHKT